MNDMNAAFATLTKYRMFRWQLRLLRDYLIKSDLPSSVDVPTGLGKTSVMALWLIALAEGASLPRRLVYVVDRRAVVDQATRFAEQLRNNMSTELASSLGLDGTRGLPISTLRGGFADNGCWLEDPSRPAIIVGTVDMVGSRLLFEGYGVSRRMRPYHAGLLGVDSLFMLDEAHLCPAFESLLRSIEEQRDGELGCLRSSWVVPSFHMMSLSATARRRADEIPSLIFQLDEKDEREPVVRARLTAQKLLKVTELTDHRSLIDCIAAHAVALGFEALANRVLVYCDHRKDAVAIKRLIDKKCNERCNERTTVGTTSKHASELLVGERRVYERKALEQWLEVHGFLGDEGIRRSAPAFVVATSAGEVGIDLDADHLVCDLVSYERMVQRLGRVNRRGGDNREAMIDVFAHRPVIWQGGSKARKEKERQALEVFEKRLACLQELPAGKGDRRDASPSALAALKREHPETVAAATTPAPLHPPLNRVLLDAWAMTSLAQHEGRPEVGPWLRGWDQKEAPRSVVVWRKHLPVRRTNDGTHVPPAFVADFFRRAPIHASEKLETESTRLFDWLLARVASIATRGGDCFADDDVLGILIGNDGELSGFMDVRQIKRLAAPQNSIGRAELREREQLEKDWRERLLPGRLLVVDERIGGCRNGMLDEKSDMDVPCADAANGWQEEVEDRWADSRRPLIRFRVKQVAAGEGEEGLEEGLGEGLDVPTQEPGWRHLMVFETELGDDGVPKRGLAVAKWHDDVEDEDSRDFLSTPQLLSDHANAVATQVRCLAGKLGLPEEEVEALAIAAKLHDDGKAARRWQRAMNAPTDGVYAKTRGGGNLRQLEGYQHEFGSLVRASRQSLPEGSRDLILHLIAAHHGYARPLIGCVGCEDGPPSFLESIAGDAALRFAQLQKDYGPWGLAWREAILRAADQAASRAWLEGHRRANHG